MSENIDDIAKEYFAALLEAAPTWGHLLADYSYAGRFEEVSREAEDHEIATLRSFAARAEAVAEAGLTPAQQLTRAVLVSDATASADLLEARLKELAADPIFGDQISMPVVLGMLGVPDATVAAAMVDKTRAVARCFHQLAERQREGVAHGRVSARFAVEGVIAQIDEALAVPPSDDPLLAAVQVPEGIDVAAWKAELAAVIESDLRPALAAYRDVLRDEVLPVARPDEQVGLCWLPDGADAYTRALRHYTTTTLTAQEIHDIGLGVVDRLADEYRALGPEVVGTDDLTAIFEALRTDPDLHFDNGEDILTASKVALDKAWAAMPDWFEVLPQAPCAVEGTTTGAKAYYFPPAPDGSRGGTFFVNIAEPEAWGTFEMESLAFHEGIPGHHLQLAIAAELEDLPEFRKHSHNAAYAEGWGLYTERLADEMGLYSGPVDRMGMLSADSLRACRLVVDTGLHSLGWSRRQAVDYMVANSPMTEAIVQAEIDRYILHPGQACSYMIGRIEILRMRREAEERLGAAFDIKAFHTAVLGSGSLPLGVLDAVVRERLG